MREAILVFDVGTTNFKTVLFTIDGEPFFTLPVPFRPSYATDGMVFQEPLDWRNAIVNGAAKAAAFAGERGLSILALSLTASRSSVIPVDRDGTHIGPAMMWQETASADIVNMVTKGENLQRIFTLAGSRPNTIYSAPKMAWLRRNRPEIYAKAHKLMGIQDYIIYFLTGLSVTDHTFASRTLLMNIHTREWDSDLLGMFGIDEDKLCSLIPPGSVAGSLTPAAAGLTGLPAGLPVITAGGDQNNAALGAGVVRQGDAMINTGTGSFIVAAVDTPVTDPDMRVMSNASAVPGQYIIEAGMPAAGSVHRWFVESFYSDIPKSRASGRYDKASMEAEAAHPGCDGLILLPHFNGSGAPHWDNRATGVFFGLGMGHGRREMARAVFESIAGEIANNLKVIKDLVGSFSKVCVAGGLSQSAFFNQLLADVCQLPMRLGENREATARGAWSQAVLALGKASSHEEALSRNREARPRFFSPDPTLVNLYDTLLSRRESLYACLAAMRKGEIDAVGVEHDLFEERT